LGLRGRGDWEGMMWSLRRSRRRGGERRYWVRLIWEKASSVGARRVKERGKERGGGMESSLSEGGGEMGLVLGKGKGSRERTEEGGGIHPEIPNRTRSASGGDVPLRTQERLAFTRSSAMILLEEPLSILARVMSTEGGRMTESI